MLPFVPGYVDPLLYGAFTRCYSSRTHVVVEGAHWLHTFGLRARGLPTFILDICYPVTLICYVVVAFVALVTFAGFTVALRLR